MKRACLAVVLLLAASACTNVVFEGTADRLRLMPNEVLDSGYAGATVVWGGRVISLREAADGVDLEVMAYPLDTTNRPRLDASPGGRFVAHFPGELPDSVFGAGATVTMAGVLGEPREAEVDGYRLALPSVLTRRVHPWP